ncbi:MAG: hypothetical protein GY778_27885 [bacterium]|nr:hypothetical protein [bacterium]
MARDAHVGRPDRGHPQLDFDYVAYTTDYLGRFERAYEGFAAMVSASSEPELSESGA